MKASLEPKREEWMAWKFMLLLLATLDEHQEMRKHDGNSKAHEANSGMGESFFQVPRDERKAKYEIHFGLLFQQTNYWSKQFLAAKLLRQSTRQALLSPALDLSAIGCLIFVCRSCIYIYILTTHIACRCDKASNFLHNHFWPQTFCTKARIDTTQSWNSDKNWRTTTKERENAIRKNNWSNLEGISG